MTNPALALALAAESIVATDTPLSEATARALRARASRSASFLAARRRTPHRPHRPGVRGWRSAPTGACWPPPATTARCGCGTRPPANPVGEPLTGHDGRVYGGGVQPRRRRCWPPPATTGRCGCGTRPPATPSANPLTGHTDAVIRGGVQPGRDDCWPPPATTGRCGCGTRPPATRSANRSTGHTDAVMRGGVQPRRQTAGLRQRRSDGAVVGPGHRRPGRRPADRPHRLGVRRWRSAPTGRCWPPPATTARCGCGTRPPATRSANRSPATPAPCGRGGVQPGRAACWPPPATTATVRLWDPATGDPVGEPLTGHTGRVSAVAFSPDGHAAGLRRRRRDGAVVGPGHRRPGRRPPHRPHRRRDGRGVQPGRRACWPPPATTGRCGCGTRPPATPSANPSPATPAGVRGGVQPRRHDCWPPPATTRRCGCGTRPPATRSANPSPATPAPCRRWRSARTADCWPPPARTGRCGCGTRPPATRSANPSPATPMPVSGVAFSPDGHAAGHRRRRRTVRLWDPATGDPVGEPLTGHTGLVWRRGVQPGRRACWPPPATTRRCGCGTRPPATRSANPSPATPTAVYGGGVQPRRHAAGLRQRRRTVRLWDPATGDPVGEPLTGHTGDVCGGGVQPGRHAAGLRQQRPDGAVVGRRMGRQPGVSARGAICDNGPSPGASARRPGAQSMRPPLTPTEADSGSCFKNPRHVVRSKATRLHVPATQSSRSGGPHHCRVPRVGLSGHAITTVFDPIVNAHKGR